MEIKKKIRLKKIGWKEMYNFEIEYNIYEKL